MAVYCVNWTFWVGEGDAWGYVEADSEAAALENWMDAEWVSSEPPTSSDNYWEDASDSGADHAELVPEFKTLKELREHKEREQRLERESFIVLGLDGGFANIGWSAVRFQNGKEPVCLSAGVLSTKRNNKETKAEDNIRRVREIYSFLKGKVKEHSPAFIAVESPSYTRFVNADRITAMFWGMLPSLAEEQRLAIVLRTPVQIKEDMTGSKKANKEEMIKAAEKISGANLSQLKAKTKREHAADAIGAAISSQKDKLFQTILAMKKGK
jgi:Holliday junction resolvasome RuvABC endonuclease subunit|tara:strand:- start:264 stop:1067 length:804 start_codon:yes stop_codon:yes gene_type:complete